MFGASKEIRHRLRKLESHLSYENPLLVEAVKGYRELDKVAYRLGLLGPDESFATHISWWPLVSVLGTFSSGKSTFINSLLKYKLQETGNQAVDDKFTVICYSKENDPRTLPGIALDADPRFPFYQMAEELEKVAPGEGARVDAYLQLKTCPSEHVRGYIYIDSPGFDADAQRTSTLKITDYIIELSDLVLVFFDARHPEPGAMQDTLKHLVADTILRKDATKCVYVLNQLDTAAKEDNPEDVIASWQRALAQEGLTAGNFFSIYDAGAANTIEDPAVQQRFEQKRNEGLQAINDRIEQVHVDRIYRIIGNLEKSAREIEHQIVPNLRSLVRRWERGVLWRDLFVFGFFGVAFLVLSYVLGWWQGDIASLGNLQVLAEENPKTTTLIAVVLAVIAFVAHHVMRTWSLRSVLTHLDDSGDYQHQTFLKRALIKNTRFLRSIFRPEVVGWNRCTKRRLQNVLNAADDSIQQLNDQYTRPSGQSGQDTN